MTGKRKNKADDWLPTRVYRGRSSYVWQPKGGGAITLCKLEADESEAVKAKVWQAFKEANDEANKCYLVDDLFNDYFASLDFTKRIKPRTQADYRRYSIRCRKAIGKMKPEAVRPVHIRKFMDRLIEIISAEDPKNSGEVTANRTHSFLSVVFGWGLERDIVQSNPVKSVRKFQEKPRTEYADDSNYEWFLEFAKNSGYPYIFPMLEIQYLCRARPNEALALTEFDISETDGVFINRGKGSKSEYTQWSPRLRAAVAFARSLHPNAPTTVERPLIHGKEGTPIPTSTYKTAMSRLKRRAKALGVQINFTAHDAKAKGVTDHPNKASGHKTKKMKELYDRLPKKEESTR